MLYLGFQFHFKINMLKDFEKKKKEEPFVDDCSIYFSQVTYYLHICIRPYPPQALFKVI